MPKPFDNVTRYLNWLDPLAWPKLLEIQAKSIRLCNADLSTVNSQADLLLLIDEQWELHVENESSSKTDTGRRIFEYNVLADKALGVPMRSVVVLLRPSASSPMTSGSYGRRLPGGSKYLSFHYEIIRVWEIPAEKFLSCGLGLLPFAFISKIEQEQLPELVLQAELRLKTETDSKTASELWTAIDVIMGLRYTREQIEHLLKECATWKNRSLIRRLWRRVSR